MHRYMGDHEANAIRSWSDRVPSKSSKYQAESSQDPAIQAYIEAKMALLKGSVAAK